MLEQQQGSESVVAQDDDEISLLDLLITLAEGKRTIAGVTGLFAAGAVAISLLLTPVFTAKTAILPPQQAQSSASAMLGQLGALAGMAGGSLGIKNPNDMYLGMLKSRTLLDAMVTRFDLKNRYQSRFLDDARMGLVSKTKAAAGKDGIISIEVDDEDPQVAADMANAYVEELYKLTSVLAVTEASQRRLFYERQLAQVKDRLSDAEIQLKSDLDSGGIAKIDEQGKTLLESGARLRAQIAVKEVQIGSMQSFAGPANPDLKLAQHELATLKSRLAASEGGVGAQETESKPLPGLASLKRLRDVKYFETMYELLAKQYELARMDEAKEASLIQVLDKALPPEKKSKPQRALIVIVATFLGFFLAVITVFIRSALRKAKGDAESAARLSRLRKALSFRR